MAESSGLVPELISMEPAMKDVYEVLRQKEMEINSKTLLLSSKGGPS